MFNKIKAILPALFRSGWTLFVLVMFALTLCNQQGQQLFIIWWLAFSGVALVSLSFTVNQLSGNRENKRQVVLNWCSWLICIGGVLCLVATNLYPVTNWLMVMYILGSLCGFLLGNWVKRKELLAWIQ